jgi:hypothetical protein
VHAIGVVQKVMVGGYLISEKPALSGDRQPVHDETGALAYERVFAQPDGKLALEFVSRQAPDLWGRNGVARVELSGPEGGSIAVEERTAAAALTARFEEVIGDLLLEQAVGDLDTVEFESGDSRRSDQPPAAGTTGRPSSCRRVSWRRRCHSASAAAKSSSAAPRATRTPIWAKPLDTSPL